MKLRKTFRSLVATTLLAVSSQAIAQVSQDVTIGGMASTDSLSYHSIFSQPLTGGANVELAQDPTGTFPLTIDGTDYLIQFKAVASNNAADSTEAKVILNPAAGVSAIGVFSTGNSKTNKNGTVLQTNTEEQLIFSVTGVFLATDTDLTNNLKDLTDGTGVELYGFKSVTFGNMGTGEEATVNGVTDLVKPNSYTIPVGEATLQTLTVAPDFKGNPDDTSKHSTWDVKAITMTFKTIPAPGADTEITAFDEVTTFDTDGGYINAPKWATTQDVINALEALNDVTITDSDPAQTVTLSWTNPENDYDSSTAGDYIFQATVDTLPSGYKDDTKQTVTITVKATTEVNSFATINNPAGGSVTNPVFATAQAVIDALPTAVKVNDTNDTATVSWTEKNGGTYSTASAASFEFVASIDALSAGYVETDGTTIPNVTVTITETDFSTANAELVGAVVGKDKMLRFGNLFNNITTAENGVLEDTGVISVAIEVGSGNEKIYEISLKVTAQAEGANRTNPKLRFRNQGGNQFIGVYTNEDKSAAMTSIPTKTDASATDSEGLKFEITQIYNKTDDVIISDNSVQFKFKGLSLGNAGTTEGNLYTSNWDNSDIYVKGASADFTHGDFTQTPTTFFSMMGTFNDKATPNDYSDDANTTVDLSSLTFDFGATIVTPAIGVEVAQTGALVEWTVEEELDVKEYQLVDVVTGEVVATVVADGSNAYSETVEEGVTVELVVVDNNGSSQSFTPADGNVVSQTYELVAGWNLIATIGDNADLSEVEAATVGTLWAWDGSKYVATDAQDAFTGVWVYATEAASATATARKAGSTLTLQPGWSLAGPANNVSRPEGVNAFSWTTKYNEVLDTYDALIKGQGYWFFATEETEIDVDVK